MYKTSVTSNYDFQCICIQEAEDHQTLASACGTNTVDSYLNDQETVEGAKSLSTSVDYNGKGETDQGKIYKFSDESISKMETQCDDTNKHEDEYEPSNFGDDLLDEEMENQVQSE